MKKKFIHDKNNKESNNKVFLLYMNLLVSLVTNWHRTRTSYRTDGIVMCFPLHHILFRIFWSFVLSSLCTLTQPVNNQLIISHSHVHLKQNNVKISKFNSTRSIVVYNTSLLECITSRICVYINIFQYLLLGIILASVIL